MFYSETAEFNQVYLQINEGKLQEALQNLMELEKRNNITPKENLAYNLVKANIFRIMGRYMEAIEICEAIYPIYKHMGDFLPLFDVLVIQAYSYMIMANVNKSETFLKQAKDLFISIKDKFSMDLKRRESTLLNIEAGNHFFKGEIQRSLYLFKKTYELVKDTGYEGIISASLGNIAEAYLQMRKLNKALKFAKAAVDINFKNTLSNSFVTLIEIYITIGDLKKAKAYLDTFREHIENHDSLNDKPRYIYSKALFLKSSLRARNRVKSEDLFRSLALDDAIPAEYRINAIINLCDLYLTELNITNELDIIDEIKPFIQKLLNIAQYQHLNLILAETYFLQAKLSILTSNFKRAQELLTQAQSLAESYGLEMLAMKISNEHDNLLKQSKLWNEDPEISLSDRLELASLKEHMEYMSRKRLLKLPEQKNEESVLLLILSEGGIPLYSQSFINEKFFEEHLFGGFLTSINAFVHEMFSEGLDRASFGKYTLLMKSIPPFLICYIFKGPSYYALQRVKLLNYNLLSNKEIWQALEDFYQMNRTIQKEDIPSLEPLITKIFIEKRDPSLDKI